MHHDRPVVRPADTVRPLLDRRRFLDGERRQLELELEAWEHSPGKMLAADWPVTQEMATRYLANVLADLRAANEALRKAWR
jgi:hypothetical protein